MLAKPGPREQRQAQVDGSGIQGVQALVEFDADGVARVQWPCDANQDLGEVGIDAPVAGLVGVGQCGARHPATESHVVELAAHRAQACLDVAQALAVSQLREAHRQKLVPARETLLLVIATITGHTFPELVPRQVVQDLGENGSARIHPSLSVTGAKAGRPLLDHIGSERIQIGKTTNTT
jgi:hypothetical protein